MIGSALDIRARARKRAGSKPGNEPERGVGSEVEEAAVLAAGIGKVGKLRRSVLAVSALAALLAGCGADEGASERRHTSMEPTADSEGAARSEEGGSGAARPAPSRDGAGSAAPALPPVGAPPPDAHVDGLPRDVPRPAGATTVETHTFANGDRLVGYEADAPPGPVFARLREDLESRGWTLEHVLDGEVQKILRASKDGYRVIALVVPQADATRIALRSVKIEE